MPENPFRIGGSVGGDYFTDRDVEVSRIARILMEPQAKLLVSGPRRMGKTSALERAVARVHRAGHHAIMVDLSTATTVADMSTRVLRAANRDLGRRFKDLLTFLARHIGVGITAKVNPITGEQSVGIDLGERSRDLEEQRRTFGDVLDAIDALAAAKRTTVGVVLDEFQEIHQFGGATAEAHLRGVIQLHKHTSYVLAGSRQSLIRQMIGKKRPFYKLLEPLTFGPVDPAHLARWIEGRMRDAGVAAQPPTGADIVRLAGPRTRDIVQLARSVFERGALTEHVIDQDIAGAFRQIVEDEDDQWAPLWDTLPPLQQNILRAIAADTPALFGAEVRTTFGLGDTGAIAKSAASLERKDLIVRHSRQAAHRYSFDSPFFRGWVIRHVLPDVGIVRDPATPPPIPERTPGPSG